MLTVTLKALWNSGSTLEVTDIQLDYVAHVNVHYCGKIFFYGVTTISEI